jgi:tRNA(Arg) A34 adenosine deaminase TadA
MKTKMTPEDKKFLSMALEAASANISEGGGPFGAVVVREGRAISVSGNRVVPDSDPTAHAEVTVIRQAAAALKTFDLSDCVIYSSCEPCPMCLGAIYWAGIRRVVYAADRHMAAAAGFSDELIYREIALAPSERSIVMERAMITEGEKVFTKWDSYPGKVQY